MRGLPFPRRRSSTGANTDEQRAKEEFAAKHSGNNTGTAVIMRGKKILVIIIALALLLACIVALRLRRDQPAGQSVSETSRLIGGPAFEVQVEMPAFNSGRAPWEIPGVISWVTIMDRGSIRQVLAPRSAR